MPESSYSKLHHRLILDRKTSEKVGTLSQLLLDPPSQTVVGFSCGGGILGGPRQSFRWQQIHQIGDDSIIIDAQTDDSDFRQSNPIPAPIGFELWTDGGNQIGKIVDLHFNCENGEVTQYIFIAKGWHGLVDGTYQVPPIAISSIGSKRMILLEHLQGHIRQNQEGLSQKVEQVTEFLKADYAQTKEDMAALKNTTQAAVDKVKDVLPMPKDSSEGH